MSTWHGGYVYRASLALVAVNEAILADRGPGEVLFRYPKGTAPHGTVAAARRHSRHGEPPCEWCRAAQNRNSADRKARRRAAESL